MRPALRLVAVIVLFGCTTVGGPDPTGSAGPKDSPPNKPGRTPRGITVLPGDSIIVLPGGTAVFPPGPTPNQSDSPKAWRYERHNGLLYQRAIPRLQYLPPGAESSTRGGDLYGPVLPNRYHADGATGDQLFLSIVRVQPPTPRFVLGPLSDPRIAELEVRLLALRTRLTVVEAALKQPGLPDEQRAKLQAQKQSLEQQLAEAQRDLGRLKLNAPPRR